MKYALPDNLSKLHAAEEDLRGKALAILSTKEDAQLHIQMVEAAMDMADVFRQFATTDEDLKVVQVLGMRTFNAFGAALKLALAGYSQKSAMIMRDILETTFLMDLFRGDRSEIEKWRLIDKKARKTKYGPFQVRVKLDSRYGDTEKKRAEHYEMLSELAGHPSMRADIMMRPTPLGDAVIGPFIEVVMLEAVVSELGRLAIMVGENLEAFIPDASDHAVASRLGFAALKRRWLLTFYGVGAVN